MSITSFLIIYIIASFLIVGVLKLIQIGITECRVWFIRRFRIKQETYIKQDNRAKLIKSIRLELFIENTFIFITPYFREFPERPEFDNVQLLIRKKSVSRNIMESLAYILSPFRLVNFFMLILILQVYIIDLLSYLKRFYLWLIEDFNLTTLKSLILMIPSTIALSLIILSYLFTSRRGLLARAKSKVNLEDFENIVRFHKKNRMILSEISFPGYENINWVFNYRKELIEAFKAKEGKQGGEKFQCVCNHLYDSLKDIPQIEKLDKFVEESDKYQDMYPFIFMGIRHVAFQRMTSLYMEDKSLSSRRKKLEGVFCTKENFKNQIEYIIKHHHANFEARLNNNLLKSLKNAVMVQEYLNKINPQFYKRNSFFSVLAFITNKDK